MRNSDGKVRSFCRMQFSQSSGAASFSSSNSIQNVTQQNQNGRVVERSSMRSLNAVSYTTKSLVFTRRKLRLDPPNKLYFPYIEGLPFQTAAPKSCYMRGVLAPGESLSATVFKFVEHPENNEKPEVQKGKVKFKIMSLIVKGEMDYVAELFDEQKDQVAVEQIMRVVFIDPEHPSTALEGSWPRLMLPLRLTRGRSKTQAPELVWKDLSLMSGGGIEHLKE